MCLTGEHVERRYLTLGYLYPDLDSIQPYLEDVSEGTGATLVLVKELAQRFRAHVIAGFPERPSAGHTADVPPFDARCDIVKNAGDDLEEYRARVRGKAYNSAVMVDPSGAVVKVFRKHFLYKADTPWADEGAGFEYVDVPALGRIAVGICMDLNRTLLRRRRPDASLPSIWRLPKVRAHPLL